MEVRWWWVLRGVLKVVMGGWMDVEYVDGGWYERGRR